MIDVPYEVKKALREGTYRKNYRFVVQKEVTMRYITTIYTLTPDGPAFEIAEAGKYILYNEEESEAFDLVEISLPNGGGSYTEPCPSGGTETWFEIPPTLPAGTILRINNFYGDYVKITKADLVTYGPGWATDFVIDNNNLVKESVSIDERMCSGDTIKYGLCEGASIEFQYFNHPNCTGGQLWAYIDVQYGEGENDWYTIPMGCFTVKKCSRQASTGIIKVTAYNKLQSDYLDHKVNDEIAEIISEGEDGRASTSIYNLLRALLGDFALKYRNEVSVDTRASFLLFDGFGRQRKAYINGQIDGYYNVYYALIYYSNSEFSRDSYYRYTADIAKVKEKIYDLFDGYYSGAGITLLSQICSGDAIAAGEIQLETQTHRVLSVCGIPNSPDFIEEPEFHTNIYLGVSVYIPLYIAHTYTEEYRPSPDNATMGIMYNRWNQWAEYFGDWFTLIKNNLTPMQAIRFTRQTQIADVTLRDLQTAVFESQCQLGQLDRVSDLFAGVELGNSRLLPAETLYPATDLYPSGARLSGSKAMYSKLWADEGNIHKWRNLIITYKGLDEEQNEKEFTLQRQVNADGTDDYNCSDNWLFKNLIWTAEQIGDYADAMVAKMAGITWFPFEMWCAGLPYLETGDEIEIPLGDQKYVSYVLQRQLKGIQNLQDTYINGTLDIY